MPKIEYRPRGKTLETLRRNVDDQQAANMMNDAHDDSIESDDMVWDWSEQGRYYRRNVLNRISFWPSWQGILAAFEDMKKTAYGQSEPSGESSDMLKIKSDGSHANGNSLTEFQVRPNLLPTTLSLATQLGIMGESQPPSKYVADPPAWFRGPQTAVTVYDPAQRQAIAQQRLEQAHQTPRWGHQFAAGVQRNAVNLISQFFETPQGIAGIRRQDPVASYERGEQPAAAQAINGSSSQQQAPAQDMGRNAAVTVQEPASVLSSTEGGSSWDIVSQVASAAYGALEWVWNYGGNQTPSGGVDAAPVPSPHLGAQMYEIEIFDQYEKDLFGMLGRPDLSNSIEEVDQLISKMISMMEKKADLGALIDRETLNIKIAKLPTFVSPEIVNALKRLIYWQPASTKIFSRLVDMLGRKDTQEYDANIVLSLINAAISSSVASQKSEALIQYERKHNLIHHINEFYGLQEEKVRNALDILLYYWESATASLDDVTLINTLKSVFLSKRLYRQQYKVEVLEAGQNAIERSPGLFRKFGVLDIGKLHDAADSESITIARHLRDFATRLELYLVPEFSVRMGFSFKYAPYVSDFLRSKYPQHEFSIGQESPIKITDETGLESSSPSLLEALLHHKVTMEFPSGTPEAIKDYITKYQSRALTRDEVDEVRKFSEISDRKEMARRIQRAGNGTHESLVTEIKKTLPQYQYILDAVSARDTLLHERANAAGSLRLAAPERYLYINVRILQLRRIEGLIEKAISGEMIKLENASVHESTLPKNLDDELKGLFKHLESPAINPEHVSPIPSLEDELVGNESLKGKLAFYLVDYLAKHGLPEMPKALSLLKSVWEALKNSLSRQPPTTLQPSTAAPSTAAPSIDDKLTTWFKPYRHTPAEFIDQWITLQTQQAGLTDDYRNVSVDISYKIIEAPPPGSQMAFFNQKIEKNSTTFKLREIASRQYLKKKREQGWDNFKIHWPSEFPPALRAKLEGGAWEDFNKFIVKFVKHDSFGKGTDAIRFTAQGIVGKKLDEKDEKTGDEYKNRPRRIIFTAQGVKTPLAGAFELDGRIYSLSNGKNYQAPQEGKRDQLFEQTIPDSLSTLVTEGLSKNERDKLDGNPLKPELILTGGVPGDVYQDVQWPYFTYEQIEPGGFARDMMIRFLQKFDDNMDRTTYSHWEQGWDTAAAFMEVALGVASLPIGAVTGPWVGVGMALLSTVPELIRMGTADTQEESKKALKALFLGLFLDLGGAALTPLMMKGLNKIAERKSRKLLQDISSQSHAPVIKLEDLKDWAIEVRKKVKGKPDISDAEVDKLVDSSGARGVGAGSVNGESWLQKLGYTSSGLYQKPKKVVSKGSVGTVYEIDDNFLRKDYSGILDESHHGRLTKAQNTVAAMDRLYGPGSAEVQIWNTKNPLEKIVTVKMKRIPGESLDSLLKKGDIRVLDEVLMWYHESDPVNELVTRLSTNGINYNDINLANTLFDKKTGKFHVVDFDDVYVQPKGETLHPGKSQAMRNKFEHDFNDFERSTDTIHFQYLDAALAGDSNNRVEFFKKYWGRETYVKLTGRVKKQTKALNFTPRQDSELVDEYLKREIKKIRHTDKHLKKLRNRKFEDIPKVDSGYDAQVKDAANWIIGASNSKTKSPGWDAEIESLLNSYAKSSEPINLTELEKIKTKLKLDAPERVLLANNDASYGTSATGKILLEKHLEAVERLLLFKSANGGVDPNWLARQMLGGIIGAHAFGDANGRLGRFAYAVILLRAKKFSRLPKSVEDDLHGLTTRYRRESSWK
ncbi:hypothetical protein [Serratia liquefaciens]|uniref:hypothetical protein n=1 Tax=Serratia liquefaciens TaxID=614 RepID=UPI0039064F8B